MANEDSFHELAIRLTNRDDEAAQEVVARFLNRLVGFARRQLSSQLQQKVDPEDVAQSALKSYFFRQQDGRLKPADWDELWRVLAVITLRKCRRQAEYFGAQVRQVSKEIASDDFAPAGREPTPQEAFHLSELVQELLATFEPAEREMLSLRLQGYQIQEIAEQAGRTERTVNRVLQRARLRLQRILGEDDA